MLVFRGLTMWLLGGQNIGPFPPGFQMIASGFIPDILGGQTQHPVAGAGWGAAIAILWMQIRARAQQEKMGVADEPFAFFAGKNAIIFIAIVGMTWASGEFPRPAQRLHRHGAAGQALRLHLGTHDRRPRIYAIGGKRQGGKAVGHQLGTRGVS